MVSTKEIKLTECLPLPYEIKQEIEKYLHYSSSRYMDNMYKIGDGITFKYFFNYGISIIWCFAHCGNNCNGHASYEYDKQSNKDECYFNMKTKKFTCFPNNKCKCKRW